MSIADYSKFNKYKELIQSLPHALPVEAIINEQFLIDTDTKKKLEIYYAPFEYVNGKARVVIVGITPGLHQMKKSFSTVLNANNQSDDDILHQVKNNSSFEGPMRINLVQMLDELGLHKHLGLSSTMELFNKASHLVHSTSILTYPVFYKGKNYSGSTPNILKTDLLKKYVVDCFATELNNLNNPLIIPLGVNVSNVLTYLAGEQLIATNCILSGFPHPSGGNGHRHKQFADNKEKMQEKLRSHFLES